ncbi:MAG: DUF5684 domain-containing protein [Verrucomicrobiota bacterium]
MEPEQVDSLGAAAIIPTILGLLITLFLVAAMWKILTKAGQPGWTILVPFYGMYLLVKIAGKPTPPWLVFVPFVNFFVFLISPFGMAARFGKGTGFGFGLLVLPFIFYPILAFGNSTYSHPPAAA